MELNLLQVLECEQVLEVLRRDKQLRVIEEDRIRLLKQDLQEVHRKSAKSSGWQYGQRICARCQRSLGKLWNSGAVCHGCSHRICPKCRVSVTTIGWRCTVCFTYRDVKFRSGEWFLEERSKKFPATGKNESVGERLLRTYGVLSHIAIVPPTPPPHLDCAFLSKSGNSQNCKPLRSSMEDLMLSVTSHIRKKSTSENDVRYDHLKVENIKKSSHLNIQKSLSDTDIRRSLKLFKVPSLPNVFKRSRESDPESWSTGAEDTTSFTSGSCGSVSTDCGPMDALSAVGELELAVAYDNTTSCLEITVGACRNLMCGDSKKKKSNVYVQVYIRPGKHAKLKTTVKKSSTNPVYREVLKHHIEHSMLFGKHLQACVFNAGSLRRKAFLGEVLIPLDGWASSRSIEGFQWYPLCTKKSDNWTSG
ncbi:synaptotagmin-like protein 3 [Boleophthalmus pectinirostris]|uniref:synaptotagmin-like protein 3 n=1 Tax=Boleophthalmus pectinirostris TaxID=150288 RepID=UPI000A1C55E4|nr:synaptotagmin-like protein 3 [Boleophthalmus pectinirostris]